MCICIRSLCICARELARTYVHTFMYISMYKKLHNGRLTLINVALAYTTGKKTDAQVGLKNGRQLVDD